jgi:hypothetical protein
LDILGHEVCTIARNACTVAVVDGAGLDREAIQPVAVLFAVNVLGSLPRAALGIVFGGGTRSTHLCL